MAERAAKRWIARFALVLGSLLLAGVCGLVTIWAMQTWGGPETQHRIWQARVRVFGPEAVGIWRDHERLGWEHIPGASGRQRTLPDYDVRYHIDADGRRRTPGQPEGDAATALFLGGSFTFGHGVEDDEVYTVHLQRAWPQLRVVNAAVNAWGTTQALITLQDALARGERLELVVYGYITHHLKRNHRGLAWLRMLFQSRGRRVPYFDIVDGELVFRGLADPEQDGLAWDETQKRQENNMTRLLLREMARLCAKHDIPFAVVYMPDGTDSPSRGMIERAVGADSLIDLNPEVNYDALHFPHDAHLTPEGHTVVARLLQPRLEKLMTPPGK